ncbi:hypothetical protein GOV09_05855 [Candidatus Woesearchaeota archaeon]|nr:hypothetical protein [Candidatus Woesearchaeota archaeon]
MEYKILNSREMKKTISLLERFGYKKKLDYAFLMNNKNRIFLVNKDFRNIDTSKLRVNNIGMYFGELHANEIRLSIEGSQLIGPDCSENILKLDDEDALDWLRGIDLSKEIEEKGYYLIKNKDDFLGCGKAVDKKLLNYVPKNRRLRI